MKKLTLIFMVLLTLVVSCAKEDSTTDKENMTATNISAANTTETTIEDLETFMLEVSGKEAVKGSSTYKFSSDGKQFDYITRMGTFTMDFQKPLSPTEALYMGTIMGATYMKVEVKNGDFWATSLGGPGSNTEEIATSNETEEIGTLTPITEK